jgi:hypothetical protein
MTTHPHHESRMEIPPPPKFPPSRRYPELEIVQDEPEMVAARRPRATRPVPRQRSPWRLADRRGLTGLGAVSLVLLLTALAAAYDGHRSGNGLSWVFGAIFVVACLAAALTAHSEDMGAVAILPPLAFVLGALVCAFFRPAAVGVGFTHQIANELLIAMLLGAPSLFIAEAFTLITTALRGMRHKTLHRTHRTS